MDALIAFVTFIVFYFVGYSPVEINGNSMHPNYQNGQYFFVSKSAYRNNPPARGDVVTYNHILENRSATFMGRIIGIPTEKIKFLNGQVYINGQVIEENYLAPKTLTMPGVFFPEDSTINIPTENYVILGDNRNLSVDSRQFGFVDKKEITGKLGKCYNKCN
jgi:signal peptidase I